MTYKTLWSPILADLGLVRTHKTACASLSVCVCVCKKGEVDTDEFWLAHSDTLQVHTQTPEVCVCVLVCTTNISLQARNMLITQRDHTDVHISPTSVPHNKSDMERELTPNLHDQGAVGVSVPHLWRQKHSFTIIFRKKYVNKISLEKLWCEIKLVLSQRKYLILRKYFCLKHKSLLVLTLVFA